MGRQEKQKQYEEYITESSPMAAVIGRRVPYHLEYLRRYGSVVPSPGGRKGGKRPMDALARTRSRPDGKRD